MVHRLDDLQIILAVSVLASKSTLSFPLLLLRAPCSILVWCQNRLGVWNVFLHLKNVRSNSVVLSFKFSTSHWLSPQIISDPGPLKIHYPRPAPRNFTLMLREMIGPPRW